VGHDVLVAKKKQQKTEKARAGADKQLEAAAKKLRAQLGVAEKSAEKWRSRAKEHRSTATKAKAELTAVRRRLEKAEASATKWKARAQAPSPASAASATPDDSWNVTRLRAEARSRGVAGYSRKSKEQLLTELGG
jgi:chromosome segregation ATPase